MRTLWIWIYAFALACVLPGCEGGNEKGIRIGVDPHWFPLNFNKQEDFVNGFVEDLLLEISRYSGMDFHKVTANWDSLLEGLRENRYDAVLSSLAPYNFNAAKYEFSNNFIDVGPVLVVAASSKAKSLQDLSGDIVGILAGSQMDALLHSYPTIVMRSYNSITDLLEAAANGEADGVLLDRLLAASYVRDLYSNVLKIASNPLTDAGLHLVAPKGKEHHFLNQFNNSLEHLKKKKKLDALLKKWQLN